MVMVYGKFIKRGGMCITQKKYTVVCKETDKVIACNIDRVLSLKELSNIYDEYVASLK